MNPSKTVPVLTGWLIALAIGFAVGYFGFNSGADTSGALTESDRPKQSAGPAKPDTVAKAIDAEEPVADLELIEAEPQIRALEDFLAMGRIDPQGAAKEALNTSNDLDRVMKLALLLQEAGAEDMAGIAEMITSESDGFEQMQQMGMLFYAWGQVDAPSAVAYAEQQGGRRGGMGVGIALSSWASADPVAARVWVEASETPERYQQGMLIGWSESDPVSALQYLSAQEGGNRLLNRWTAPQFAQNLIQARGVWALDDAAALPASGDRNELVQRLVDELGESDPVAAASRLQRIKDPEVLREAVPGLAQEWAQQDPLAALKFVSQYEGEGETYANALAEVVEEWAETDPLAAGNYLNDQPASPALDRAVAEYSREAARVDPAAAMTFAISVQDEGMRSGTVRNVAAEWNRTSPEDYATWAAENPEIAPTTEELENESRGGRRRFGPPE